MASPSLFKHVKSVAHKHHPFDATDHATLIMVLDFDKAESGPGIFRCQPSLHANKEYQTMIRDKIRQVLYECVVTQDAKDETDKAVLKKDNPC